MSSVSVFIKQISIDVYKAIVKFLFITGVQSEYVKAFFIDLTVSGFCLFLQKY